MHEAIVGHLVLRVDRYIAANSALAVDLVVLDRLLIARLALADPLGPGLLVFVQPAGSCLLLASAIAGLQVRSPHLRCCLLFGFFAWASSVTCS